LAEAVTRTTVCRGGCVAAKVGGDGDVGDCGVAVVDDGVYYRIPVEVCCRRKTPIGTDWASEVTANGNCCSSSWFRRRRPSGDHHRIRTTTTRPTNQKCWPVGKRNRWPSTVAVAKTVGVAVAVVVAVRVGALQTAPLVVMAPPDHDGDVGWQPYRSAVVASQIQLAVAVNGARLVVVGRRSFRAIHRLPGGEGCGVAFPENIQPRLARSAKS